MRFIATTRRKTMTNADNTPVHITEVSDETLYKIAFQNDLHFEDAVTEIARRNASKTPKEVQGEPKEVVYSWLQDEDEEDQAE
jgi:hypothetical protein